MFGFFITVFFLLLELVGLSHCLDGSAQAALVASGLVLVNDLLVSDTVDDADIGSKCCGCSCFIASFNCLHDLLDRCA